MDESRIDNDQTQQVQDTQGTPLLECQSQLQQCKDKYLYLNAEFDNYKKRLEKERATWIEHAQDVVLLDILPVLDDLERAISQLHSQKLPDEVVSHFEGIELILKALHKTLKKYDIEEVPLQAAFDPERFEAVMQVASGSGRPGDIVSILQKGYTRKSRVLRPAQVSVAQ